MNRLLLPGIVCLVLAVPAGTTFAIHGHQCTKTCVKCPNCDGCCKLEVSEGKEKKHYWSVETKQICVPRFVFPWQNKSRGKPCAKGKCGCGKKSCSGGNGCKTVSHNGSYIRTICTLKKNSYECPTCEYEWSVVDDGEGCTSASCTE